MDLWIDIKFCVNKSVFVRRLLSGFSSVPSPKAWANDSQYQPITIKFCSSVSAKNTYKLYWSSSLQKHRYESY